MYYHNHAKAWFLVASMIVTCVLASEVSTNSLKPDFNTTLQTTSLKAGEEFRDSINEIENGPRMIVIPAGHFTMGSPETEVGREVDEGPTHDVTIEKQFALGATEITVSEFAKFVQATDYKTDAEKYGGSWLRNPDVEINDWMVAPVDWRSDHIGIPSRPDNPVVHITWNDAKNYISWLSRTTGKNYRLPTEAELEYVNRAGSQTIYPWGDDSPPSPIANVRGALEQSVTPPQIWSFTSQERSHVAQDGPTWYAFPGYSDGFGGLAPVASFAANSFNLYDTTGNVWEWTEDCYVSSYDSAPANGQANLTRECTTRVLRGGSFYCFPRHIRSANRWSRPIYTRGFYIGFRVARDL